MDDLRTESLTLVVPGARGGPVRTLLSDATLRFAPGECWCIVGPNGAGKTTLLDTLAGLRAPAAGLVTLDGRRLSDWSASSLARRRAYLPQRQHDAFAATVLDTVLLGRHPHLGAGRWRGRWESERDRETAMIALRMVDMEDFAGHDVRSLSGGERQRVALATMLAQQAPLLLCDEPLAHLDPRHQLGCLDVLLQRSQTANETVLFVCHDLTLARAFASHALLLDGQGGFRAGPAARILSPDPLSQAFGLPISAVEDGGRLILIPAFAAPGAEDRGPRFR